MSGKIRGGPPKAPTAGAPAAPSRAKKRPSARPGAGAGPADSGSDDLFESTMDQSRSALRSALAGRAPAGAPSKTGASPHLRFTDADLEYLNGFLIALGEQPQANRKKRAKMLVEHILRRKRLAPLLAKLSEVEREAMGEAIAEALSDSAHYGQLVDTVTERASK
jgi:hypothetical protein